MDMTLLTEAAHECMSPDQMNAFEALFVDTDLFRRYTNCVRKRLTPDAMQTQQPFAWKYRKPEWANWFYKDWTSDAFGADAADYIRIPLYAAPIAPLDAAPEQKPVAWECASPYGGLAVAFLTSKMTTRDHYESQGWRVTPLYAAPATRAAAREDDDPQIIAAANRGYAAGLKDGKALGAALPSDAAQAPVAWRYQTPTGWHATTDSAAATRVADHHEVQPRYAAPVAPSAAGPTTGWKAIPDLPPVEVMEWYGDQFSAPVLLNDGEKMIEAVARWSFIEDGWVGSNFTDGPSPADYEHLNAKPMRWMLLADAAPATPAPLAAAGLTGNAWQTGAPPVPDGKCREFIIAVRRAQSKPPAKVFVFSANYANNFTDDGCLEGRDGDEFIADGWYQIGVDMSGEYNDVFQPIELGDGDAIEGWQELPKWDAALLSTTHGEKQS